MKRLLLASCITVSAVTEIPRPDDAPKPLTPEQSAAAFKLPDGFRMEVVASEPLIASPSGVCWDERGRLFVCELHGYNLEGQLDIEELNKTGQLDTQVRRVQADEKFKQAAKAGTFGVVKLLRDTDGDGRMDKADVWAGDLPPAYGIVPARGGIIVACAPHIVFLADRDGDGKAETREILFTGFGTGALERGINSPQWGADEWIYFGRGWGGGKITGPHLREPVQLPNSDFRIRADGTAIEPVSGGTHTFGFATTESGDRFVVTTTTSYFVAPLPWRSLARNPDISTPSLQVATGDRRIHSLAPPHPWRQRRADDPAYFKYYRDRYGAAESEAGGWFTSACGPLVYRDSALPGLRGHYFICEPSGNVIHRSLIDQDGPGLKLRRAPDEEASEFAATRDPWSHPIQLSHGPDGAIWVVDYYREIIEDYSAIPRHLQQQYGLYNGADRGRIYRLTHKDAPRPEAADMSAHTTAALVRELAGPLFWRRQTAQRLLVERGEKSAASALRALLGGKDAAPSALIAAMRTLDQLGALAAADLLPLVKHRDAAVRIHALQLGERRLAAEDGRALLDAILAAAATEREPRVQIQFALSLGEARGTRALAMLARYAREHIGVQWMDAALLSSLHGRGADMLAELMHEPGGSGPLLEPLAQMIATRRDEAELARTLKLIESAPSATQATLRSGLAKAPKAAAGKASALPVAVQAAAEAKISDVTFRKYLAAFAQPRDLKRGHEVFVQTCATCHRIGDEGKEVGPDLLGQLGMSEESLLQDILMPGERIRPGYETTLVTKRDGTAFAGVLKDDGATSLRLLLPGGTEQTVLRKEVAGVQRLPSSLMPSFADALPPADVANVLGWLRSKLRGPAPAPANPK